eukprot:IDg561t1
MASNEENKIQRFNGRSFDDFNLWRSRAEITLKSKGYWSKLLTSNCSQDVKDKASAMIVGALGDSALRVCISKIDDPMGMLKLLDSRYASTRAATRISVLTSLYTRKYTSKQDMPKYINEFEALFSQLEKIGDDAALPDSHKAPLLL